MTWLHIAWAAAGIVLGLIHVAGVSLAARQPTTFTPLIGLARLLTVGLGLAAAAVFGGILPAAAGWAGGFFVSVTIMQRRTKHAPAQHSAHEITSLHAPAVDTPCNQGRSVQ